MKSFFQRHQDGVYVVVGTLASITVLLLAQHALAFALNEIWPAEQAVDWVQHELIAWGITAFLWFFSAMGVKEVVLRLFSRR